MAALTDTTAREVAARVEAAGLEGVTADDVWNVVKWGSVEEGIVSPDHDAAVTERIQEILDEMGVTA